MRLKFKETASANAFTAVVFASPGRPSKGHAHQQECQLKYFPSWLLANYSVPTSRRRPVQKTLCCFTFSESS